MEFSSGFQRLENQKPRVYLLNLRTHAKITFSIKFAYLSLKTHHTRIFFMLSYMYENIFDINGERLFYCGFGTNIRNKIHRRLKTKYKFLFSYLTSLSLSELSLMFHFRSKIFNYLPLIAIVMEMLNNPGGNC